MGIVFEPTPIAKASPPPEQATVQIYRVMVIYNPRAGTLLAMSKDPARTLRELFELRGIEAELHAFTGTNLTDLIERGSSSVDAVVVCGGDGSILSVVNALGDRKPLALLPGGTMNILARDLGLPLELEAAADVIQRGRIRTIDLAYVNDHLFCVIQQ